MKEKKFDVIIVGGSYAGLSAAMALGRSLRKVLIIDSGNPCNKQTPYSHNFITLDGSKPAQIAAKAKEQVLGYNTVTFYNGFAVNGFKDKDGFTIQMDSGEVFSARKLVLATGVKDIMPDIPGFRECWGISAIHCPYCHGYEVRDEPTGILGNGEYGFEFSKLINQWTKKLTLFTNGQSTLTSEQTQKLKEHQIEVNEAEIERMDHVSGILHNLVARDGTVFPVKAIYSRPAFSQHSDIPKQLGCAFTEHGHISADMFQKTSVPGVFACGDNVTMMRSVASAVYTGSMAGAMANKELIEDDF